MNKIIFFALALLAGLILFGYGWLSGNKPQTRNTDDLSNTVLRGLINVTDNKVESFSLWVRGKEANGVKFTSVEIGTSVKVDVLNCAGYVATATATLNENEAWEVKVESETVALDAVEKIKACTGEPKSKYISSNAFAVAPVDEKRKQIKLNKLEKPAIYNLPVSIQLWAIKDSISNWVDTDGDGKVDLVSVSGYCSTSEESICKKVLSWNGFSWIEIAYSKPA